MGYHVGGLLNQFFSKKKHNDYIEMMLHHMVTAYLYTFSYMSNTLVGAVVVFLHDSTDVLVSWTRIWAETPHARVTAYSFVSAQVMWTYMRVYWLWQCIYVSTVKLEVYSASSYMQPIFGFLLTCLLVLHIYWQYLMIGILFNYVKKGVAEDTVNNVKIVVDADARGSPAASKEGRRQTATPTTRFSPLRKKRMTEI
jgi:hypothetical protein